MRTLIVFYSRTGYTRKLAEKLSNLLAADKEEVIDQKSRKGIFGYLGAGREGVLKKSTEISSVNSFTPR